MRAGIVLLMSLWLQACFAIPAAAQSVTQRQPAAAQSPVENGRVVLSEYEGTLVWRASDDPSFSLRTLANYVAPIVWFSPDEPLLRGGAHLPQPLPPLKGANPPNAPSRVYYDIPLVLIRDSSACNALVAEFSPTENPLAKEDLAWNDEPGGPPSVNYPPLDCLDSVKIRFFFYYASEVGVGAHSNDFESLQVNVRIERNRPMFSFGPSSFANLCADSADSGHCAFVTGVFGSAHGIAWYTNGLNVDKNRDTLLPLSVLVEEGKHASAPDRNGDGVYTPGFDVDIHPNDAWGVRDILRTRWLQGPAFRADMAKRRLEKDRVFPPVPNWRIAETWAVRTVPGAAADPGKVADDVWKTSSTYKLRNIRTAIAGVEGGEEKNYCDASSDQLSSAIPHRLGCDGGHCEPLVDLIRGEEGCRQTRVFPYKGWPKMRQRLAKLNIGGTHDEYLTWSRFFGERVMPGFRQSGTSRSGWWIPPVSWNVPGLDGWVSARWNFWRVLGENTPTESPIDVLYSLSAARYMSFYAAVGRDALPVNDEDAPGRHRTALEAGFKWRFSIPVLNVFSGVRVGLRADDPSHFRYPRMVLEIGGGSW